MGHSCGQGQTSSGRLGYYVAEMLAMFWASRGRWNVSNQYIPPAGKEPETPLAYRPRETARALGISERTLWAKTKAGDVPHLRLGRAILYPVAMLEQWLREQVQGGGE